MIRNNIGLVQFLYRDYLNIFMKLSPGINMKESDHSKKMGGAYMKLVDHCSLQPYLMGIF